MGTNCAPLVRDLHIRSYDTGFFGGIHVAHPFSFLCCLDIVFVFALYLVCLMLSVSLDYPFFIASSVLSTVYFVFLHLPILPTISYSVPDLPLCLGVLKHRTLLARRGHLPAKKFSRWIFAYKMWCNFNILTIPTFPEHVCLTSCVGLSGLPPTEPKWGASQLN
jgi:hypothetical protein